jgi:hypothetical protein
VRPSPGDADRGKNQAQCGGAGKLWRRVPFQRRTDSCQSRSGASTWSTAGERPSKAEQSAMDCRWSWSTTRRAERRVLARPNRGRKRTGRAHSHIRLLADPGHQLETRCCRGRNQGDHPSRTPPKHYRYGADDAGSTSPDVSPPRPSTRSPTCTPTKPDHTSWPAGSAATGRSSTRPPWVRDVTFDEDRSQILTATGPQVMAALRNSAIGALRTADIINIAVHAVRTEEDGGAPLIGHDPVVGVPVVMCTAGGGEDCPQQQA